MSVRILSGAVLGIDAYLIDVEVDISNGFPAFDLVGLAEGAVRESKVRVRSALKNSGFRYPLHSRRITVNMAPADIRKEGAGFDLPIALGLLAGLEVIPPQSLREHLFLGELALSGEIKPVRGVLPIAAMAREEGIPYLMLPVDNCAEASVVEGVQIFPVSSLAEVVELLQGESEVPAAEPGDVLTAPHPQASLIDFEDVKGQEYAKRALEVAASGNHNLIMVGPPGSGKTMLARRLATILPPLSFEEALQSTKVYSVSGLLPGGSALLTRRPFRSPHHTISDAGLIGGGAIPRPGEVSLAHHGVLFLDELPEFRRHVLEVLRQPLEERKVTITRAAAALTYPANFLLVAAMNPCPCGAGSGQCLCSPGQLQRYRGRLSGPLLDRIDLHLEVPPISFQELSDQKLGESSQTIRERVIEARQRQERRFQQESFTVNAEMQPSHLRRYCRPDEKGMALLELAVDRLGMSARAFDRILKVARTIADLEGADHISKDHISEAVHYRSLDRRYWL